MQLTGARRTQPSWRRAVIGLFAVAVVLQFTTASCVFVSDQFVCGKRQTDNGAAAKICNGAGESCICSKNRCAVPDGKCSSRLRYAFGDEDCVRDDDAKTAVTQFDATHGFCPGEGPVAQCGLALGGAPCAANEACICATNRCARFDAALCPESRYVDSASGQCIPLDQAQPELMLFGSAGSAGTLCPAFRPLAPPCGISISGAAPVPCPGTSVCVCAEEEFRCAYRSAYCDGYAWQDGNCVATPTPEVIEDPALQVDKAGYCPGQNPGGAGGMAGAGGSSGSGGAAGADGGTAGSGGTGGTIGGAGEAGGGGSAGDSDGGAGGEP